MTFAAIAAVLVLGQVPVTGNRLPVTDSTGSSLTVTLVTIETGELIWERFGHNALWVHDAAAGTDHLYDYGRFSFEQANFFYNFARGKMWYSMGDTEQVDQILRFYQNQGRKIWLSELDLTPGQKTALRDFLLWNIQPEHAGYFYDYYRDNCSTRIRDALDKVLGGAIARYAAQPSDMTWREETRRLNQHNVFLYSALMIGLGQPTDSVMTRWQQMFLPMRLREHLDSVRVSGPDGVARPVVKSTRVLAEGGRWPVPQRPDNWTLRYLVAGLVLGGILLLLARKVRWGFIALGTLWALVCGLFGIILTWLWAFSTHVAAHNNENLFLFNLLAFALAIVLPAGVRGKRWAEKPARRLALAVAALAALGLVLKVVPLFHQSNLDLIAFALPVHAGLYLGLRTPSPS